MVHVVFRAYGRRIVPLIRSFPARSITRADLPEEWARGELGELMGVLCQYQRDLADDASLEAVGERRAIAKIMKAVRAIQKR